MKSSFQALQEFRSELYAVAPPLADNTTDALDAATVFLSRRDLESALPQLGITRVGDLTGLDNLGVPVWFACRPESRSLCVSNGKGLNHEAAWVSAVMESAEHAITERAATMVSLVETTAGMRRRGLRSVPLDRQSRCALGRLDPDAELAWVRGISWREGDEIYAPYELVGVDLASQSPWNSDAFRMSSLGLAAGADLCGATLHALRELIEDDALFGPLVGGPGSQAEAEIVFNDTGGQDLRQLIARLSERNMDVQFFEASDGIDMPVMLAGITPRDMTTGKPAHFCGSACRSSREEAAVAALLEAVQTRLVFVSGARDDLLPEEYGQIATPGTDRLFVGHRFEAAARERKIPAFGPGALRATASAIFAAEIADFYVFALGGSELGFEVVRVLADDLVSMSVPDHYVRTGRAGTKLIRRWARS